MTRNHLMAILFFISLSSLKAQGKMPKFNTWISEQEFCHLLKDSFSIFRERVNVEGFHKRLTFHDLSKMVVIYNSIFIYPYIENCGCLNYDTSDWVVLGEDIDNILWDERAYWSEERLYLKDSTGRSHLFFYSIYVDYHKQAKVQDLHEKIFSIQNQLDTLASQMSHNYFKRQKAKRLKRRLARLHKRYTLWKQNYFLPIRKWNRHRKR